MKLDVLIAGVGGQGNLFASRVLATVALEKGLEVAATETIGAAQRGGSVVSHLRIADRTIHSPLVGQGQAEILLGFEPLEALRNARLLSPEGVWVLNSTLVPTVLSNMGLDRYPELDEITAALKQRSPRGYVISASDTAMSLGSSLLSNVVMLGALTRVTDFFPPEAVERALSAGLKEERAQANLAAFRAGRSLLP